MLMNVNSLALQYGNINVCRSLPKVEEKNLNTNLSPTLSTHFTSAIFTGGRGKTTVNSTSYRLCVSNKGQTIPKRCESNALFTEVGPHFYKEDAALVTYYLSHTCDAD